MKLLTHTAFGLFLGTLFYYFLNLDFGFVLLTGFAAFLPDIDWRMQNSWSMGNVHRKVLHNIWVMIAMVVLCYFVFNSLVLSLGVVVGFVSHLTADSFTKRGVYWFYPLGKENESYHLHGQISTGTSIENYVQNIFFVLSGFLFLSKEITLDVFSLEGIMTATILLVVGFYIYKKLAKTVKRVIRRTGL